MSLNIIFLFSSIQIKTFMWIEQYIIGGVQTVIHDKQYYLNFKFYVWQAFGPTGLQPESYYKRPQFI